MKTHGMSLTKRYAVWNGMIQRTTNPKCPRWDDYGGRGIGCCGTWQNEGGFLQWWADMGPTYEDGLQLDRRENDEGYSPDNCRWVTPQQNSWNRRVPKKGVSKYTGICWHEGMKKWRVKLGDKRLGNFTSELEAAKVYDTECLKQRREFAKLNFPIEEK